MHRHTNTHVGQQFGRRSDEDRDGVTGGHGLTQHVTAQRSGRAKDDDASHHTAAE